MSSRSLADLRAHYTRASFTDADADADPIAQFQAWFDQAVEAEAHEPNAMTLATVGPDGRPSARLVLLKGLDDGRFVFYTNLESRKAQDIQATGVAALVFWWPVLERQIRVEGRVEPVSDADADAYYAVRPRGSQEGAWASPQSRPLPDRAVLEARLAEVEARFEGEATIPRPPFWGGFHVIPERFEFWQGRPSRLHDRLAYTPSGDEGWTITRLGP